MTFNEFLMPTLPQAPAAGFKGSGAIHTTTPDSSSHAAASTEGQSFLATLNQVSEAKTPGAAHSRKLGPTKELHHSSEESAAEIQNVNAAPFFYSRQTIGMSGALPPGMGIMNQPHSLFGTQFESPAGDISPQTTTWLHFEHLMNQIGLNSDAEGKMEMHAQLMRFWQWIAQMTQSNAEAPIEFQVPNRQITASGMLPVHWTDSIFLGPHPANSGPGGQTMNVSAHAIQSLEDLLMKMESHFETDKTGGFENAKTGLWGKDQVPLPGTQNDSMFAMHLDVPRDGKSKMSRQSRLQTRQTGLTHSAIQNSALDDIMAKPADKAFNMHAAGLKTQALAGDVFAAKIFHIEGENKDSGLLFTNDPMLERIFKLEDASRTSEQLQRPFSADSLNQIIQKAVLSLKNGQNEVRIALKPDFLGHIQMRIVTENQQVAVKIFAESPFVKDMLESNLHQLKTELQAQGLTIDELEVSVGYDSERETDPNQAAAELKRSKTTGLNRSADSDTSPEAQETSSAGSADIKETAIDYFA